jgi:nucleotide-binding universal stress UspA family protein
VGDLGPTITVGFDGSAGAEAALRLALAEARLRDAELRVVHAWLPTP